MVEENKARNDFPKNTLEEAISVAKAIEDGNGGQPWPPVDTAIALNMSPASSSFKTLLSSSIRYGLTKGSYNVERISIEALGRDIVEPKSDEDVRQAIAKAALEPEVFRLIYDYYRNKKLPEEKFFQNTIVREFHVAKDNAETCVKIFNANMQFAGFIKVAPTGKWLSDVPVASSSTRSSIVDDEEVAENNTENDNSINDNYSQKEDERKSSGGNAIFVGHGKNKVPLQQLKTILEQYSIPHKIAIDEPNEFRPISQKVADTMESCGAAILIFTADEEFYDKDGNVIWRPSENVVYELGASAVLYGRRVIIFKENNVSFPSNFKDIGYIPFDKDALSSKTNELFKELIAFGLIKVTVGN